MWQAGFPHETGCFDSWKSSSIAAQRFIFSTFIPHCSSELMPIIKSLCVLGWWCSWTVVAICVCIVKIGAHHTFPFVGTTCFRGHGRRDGERRRKSVRGCIVSQDLSVLNLVIVKKGENDLPGLTDTEKPRMRGPKRASKIRKLFNLSKEDDVRKYVNTYRRTFTTKNGTSFSSLILYEMIWK